MNKEKILNDFCSDNIIINTEVNENIKKIFVKIIKKNIEEKNYPINAANILISSIFDGDKPTGEILTKIDNMFYLNSELFLFDDINITKENFYSKLKKKLYKEDKKINFELKRLNISSVYDNVEKYYKIQPFFYDKSKIFWFWNLQEKKYEKVDEIDLLNGIELELNFIGQTVTSRIKNEYIESFKRIGRLNMPKEAPNTWVQFKDEIFDFKTKERFEATPEYFLCNPINYKPNGSDECKVMDKLFEEWVGKEYVETVYEIIAYCCITDYPIHLIFCFVGSGRNGKSKLIDLIEKFLGIDNICSSELDCLVKERFESAKLYKKLLCTMGETNFNLLTQTSKIKKLSGQDTISFEFKGKDSFDDKNYAKILIASNSMPVSDDTSDGFYRRWMILDFPNEFPEGKNILDTIPEEEYNHLATKCINIIPNLLKKGKFSNQGTIEERKKKYIQSSNPISIFLKNCCNINIEKNIKYNELYNAYKQFLLKNKKRVVTIKTFKIAMEEEGFYVEKENFKLDNDKWTSALFINGINLKPNWKNYIYDLV